jgi:flagellar basal-body rod protein FlgF
MIRGFYTAAAGMISQQRRQEMLTNNLANAETPGFKEDDASLRAFPNLLIKAIGTDNRPLGKSHYVGELSTGVYLQESTPNFRQGEMQETTNNTDIALIQGAVPVNEATGQLGALFFTVEDAAGELRYSRNGNFTIGGNGFLTANGGFYVLDNDGARINVGNEDFKINRDGLITIDGNELAQLNVVLVEDAHQLVKEGSGLLRYEGELPIATAIGNGDVTYQLMQGFVERSNVDTARTMTEMMTAFRAFEANQKVLQAYDRSMEKAVNEIGRLG